MEMEVKLLQMQKHLLPKQVTVEGILTNVKLLQSLKQSPPIEVTVDGIVTEDKLPHPRV